jgi:hypothetical protein
MSLLDGVSIYTTADVLRVAREAEAATAARKCAKRRQKEKDKDSDDLFDYSI